MKCGRLRVGKTRQPVGLRPRLDNKYSHLLWVIVSLGQNSGGEIEQPAVMPS
jgi:hypothetical protein